MFLALQSIFLIDFAYEWSEAWVSNYERSEDTCFWRFWLLSITAVLVCLSLVLAICNLSAASDCGFPLTSSVFSLIAIVAMSALAVLPYFENGCKRQPALLTSTFLGLYCAYQQWSALRSDTEMCWDAQSFVVGNVALGLAFVTISVVRMAVRTSPDSDKPSADTDAQTRSNVYYHGFMCLSAFYLAMLLTLWGSVEIEGSVLSFSSFGHWTSLTMEWGTVALFAWSLAAPKCIPDRDFA